jgi:hypothetical protein
LWRDWTASCAAGELAGIAVAAALAVALDRLLGPAVGAAAVALAVVVMALAGVVEGSSIAWFQWRVLRRRLPGLRLAPWLGATVAVAMLGWLGGTAASLSVASTPSDASAPDPPAWAAGLAAAAFGAVAGAVFGAAQWLVLRGEAERPARWIAVNSAGWAVAVPCISIAATLPASDTPAGALAALGAAAGLMAGLVLGAVTGLGVVRLRPIAAAAR